MPNPKEQNNTRRLADCENLEVQSFRQLCALTTANANQQAEVGADVLLLGDVIP